MGSIRRRTMSALGARPRPVGVNVNRLTRTVASLGLTAAVAVTTIAPGTAANASASPSSILTFQNVWTNPGPNYLNNTCVFDLSMIADFAPVTTLTQCGITATFSTTMEKRSVQSATWGVWNPNPNQVETPSPDVLYSLGAHAVQISFSSPRRIAGYEIQPSAGTQSFKGGYYDASGVEMGQINQTLMAGKARLVAAKSLPSPQVSMLWISSGGDFAIARLRVKP